MRHALAGLMIALVAIAVSAQQPQRAAAPQKDSTAPALPPLVYICPMPQDAEIMEDKPGKCPKCGMLLTPVRLDSKFWCPTHQTIVVRDAPGKCPLDGKDLVQVTLSESWSCADKPDTKLLEPGVCSNGQPRRIKYELAAHGDHNPKHGGQFFMASDQWHHIEGTYPQAGLFRIHFYDNFSKPMSPKGFTGFLVLLDSANKEVASFPLTTGRDNRTMETRIPAASAGLPLNAAVRLKFKADEKENFFNFPFSKLTKEPAASPASASTTTVKPGGPAAARPADPAASARARSSAAPTSLPVPSPPPPAATDRTPLIIDSPLSMPPGLVEATDESRLPKSVEGLVAELDTRATEVATLVNAGELAQVWLPAMGTKTVALALDTHVNTLPERQRAAASAAVKQIVVASWELDNYGDLGNRQRITNAYNRLAAAVQSLKTIYAQ